MADTDRIPNTKTRVPKQPKKPPLKKKKIENVLEGNNAVQRELFCQEYVIDFNATQAAIRAKYSEKTSGSIGYDLLKTPEIWERIHEIQDERAQRTKVTQDRILLELRRLIFSNMKQVGEWDGDGRFTMYPSSNLPNDVAASISEIQFTTKKDGSVVQRVKFHSKTKAIELAMRYHGMLIDKKEISGQISLSEIFDEQNIPDDGKYSMEAETEALEKQSLSDEADSG